MKLIEFDLDLVYVASEGNVELIMAESGVNRDEAVKLDYQMNWKDKRRAFSLQTRCMSAFLGRLFGYIITKDCKKIIVECVESLHGNSIMKFSGGFYDVQVQFNYDKFLKLSDLGKKKMSLELLMTGVRQVAADQNWDMEPFESTYRKIIEAGYVNEWTWKNSAKSPDKKAVASIFFSMRY